jgi:DNA-binding IclR family transcriptional regulator
MIPSNNDDRYMVPVLRSTFQVLSELAIAGTLNLNDLVVRTGLPKSTVFRILRSLSVLGYVLRNEQQRTYWLSPKFGDLSHAGAWSEPLRRVARPHMLKLRDRFGERPGGWDYVHSSALGKATLAFAAPQYCREHPARPPTRRAHAQDDHRPGALSRRAGPGARAGLRVRP